MGDPPSTLKAVLDAAASWLEQKGVEAPRRSAEWLLGHVLGLDRLQLYLQHDRPLEESERAALRALIARRAHGEPIAYLCGTQDFCGHELEVGPGVLIPRPETEELVELVLARLPETASSAIDLGTGSGAIPIALCHARPGLHVTAVEVDEKARAIAERNIARFEFGGRIRLLAGSWWEPVREGETFDLVVSNPPYVDPDNPSGLEAAVRRFEPDVALFTPPSDPGAPYREIATQLATRLRTGGLCALETGVGSVEASAEALRAVSAEAGLGEVEIVKDLSGHDRFVVARRNAVESASS